MEKLDIALVQMTATDDINQNIEQIKDFLTEIDRKYPLVGASCYEQKADAQMGYSALNRPEIIFFPENSLFLRLKQEAVVPTIPLDHGGLLDLNLLAQRFQFTLHLGSVPVLEQGLLYNASVWIHPRPNGIERTYQKIHLFDIELEGREPIRESDVFTAGAKPVITSYKNWVFGESICYDLRFSELYSYYGKNKVDAILIPSSFLVETGRAHWESLLRARAIENQCFVIASAQVGPHQNASGDVRHTFGHSMVVGPWGDVLVDLKEKKGFDVVRLDKKQLLKVQKQIPMSQHRRL